MSNKKAKLDYELCSACGACAFACPTSFITMDYQMRRKACMTNYPNIPEDLCTGCGLCARACPLDAITMHRYDEQAKAFLDAVSYKPDTYEIVAEKCVGCTACAKVCPVGAIEGTLKSPHRIKTDECIKCGDCFEACRPNAISVNGVLPESKPKKAAAPAASVPKYEIVEERCKGCTACAKACPIGAIEGELKTPHKIRQEDCIECGACYDKCKLKAIAMDGKLPELAPKKEAPPAPPAEEQTASLQV